MIHEEMPDPNVGQRLTSYQVGLMGHAPLDLSTTGVHREGEWTLFPNGQLVYRQQSYEDMQEVEIDDGMVQACRPSGYGKVPQIAHPGGPTLFRYIHRLWWRLTAGGTPLGPSVFYRVATQVPEWSRLPCVRHEVKMEGGLYQCGPLVTLRSDGTVVFADCRFDPVEEVDVCSPQAEIARELYSPHLAIRVPVSPNKVLPLFPRANGPQIQWYEFIYGKWCRIDMISGPSSL